MGFGTGIAIGIACGWGAGFGPGMAVGMANGKKQISSQLEKAVADGAVSIASADGQALSVEQLLALLDREYKGA